MRGFENENIKTGDNPNVFKCRKHSQGYAKVTIG